MVRNTSAFMDKDHFIGICIFKIIIVLFLWCSQHDMTIAIYQHRLTALQIIFLAVLH